MDPYSGIHPGDMVAPVVHTLGDIYKGKGSFKDMGLYVHLSSFITWWYDLTGGTLYFEDEAGARCGTLNMVMWYFEEILLNFDECGMVL